MLIYEYFIQNEFIETFICPPKVHLLYADQGGRLIRVKYIFFYLDIH